MVNAHPISSLGLSLDAANSLSKDSGMVGRLRQYYGSQIGRRGRTEGQAEGRRVRRAGERWLSKASLVAAFMELGTSRPWRHGLNFSKSQGECLRQILICSSQSSTHSVPATAVAEWLLDIESATIQAHGLLATPRRIRGYA